MKIQFETQSCGRCAGSGRYSYCPGYGSQCFSCKGKGTRLSSKGQRAKNAYESQIMEYLGVPAETLIPGNKVFSKAWGGVMGNDSPVRLREVTSVDKGRDGRTVLTFKGGCSYGYKPEELVRLGGDEFKEVVQDTMKAIAKRFMGAKIED